MRPLSRLEVAAGMLLLAAVALIPSRVAIWLDDRGQPVLTNRPLPELEEAKLLTPEQLRLHWGGEFEGEPLSEFASSSDENRFERELLAARSDVVRGEVREGLRRLRRLHREFPSRPEAAWLLAQVERRRGRLVSAKDALDTALSVAADMPENWRAEAEALRGEIDAELVHADRAYVEGAEIRVDTNEHFAISYDHQFAGRQFGDQVLEMLERARIQVGAKLGRSLQRKLDVRLYTKAQYLESYKHRFGFATVGFYDGAIHVVAGRHPKRNLYALLLHEYAHAVFEEVQGSHQPFFMNEGIADRFEESARGRKQLSRSEWRELLDALRGEDWIPLHSIVRGFGGLKGKRALLAYLQSRAAVQLIEHEKPGAIERWLASCARGVPWQDAMSREIGWDVSELEENLERDVLSRFPEDPLVKLRGETSLPEPSSRSRRGSPSSSLSGAPRASSRSDERVRG